MTMNEGERFELVCQPMLQDIKEKVDKLFTCVVIGNGEPSLREQVRNHRRIINRLERAEIESKKTYPMFGREVARSIVHTAVFRTVLTAMILAVLIRVFGMSPQAATSLLTGVPMASTQQQERAQP